MTALNLPPWMAQGGAKTLHHNILVTTPIDGGSYSQAKQAGSGDSTKAKLPGGGMYIPLLMCQREGLMGDRKAHQRQLRTPG